MWLEIHVIGLINCQFESLMSNMVYLRIMALRIKGSSIVLWTLNKGLKTNNLRSKFPKNLLPFQKKKKKKRVCMNQFMIYFNLIWLSQVKKSST